MTRGSLPSEPEDSVVPILWGIEIPLRDGVHLSATVYLPPGEPAPRPAIFTLTPYIGQTYHSHALYFASHGHPFLTVDVRGRGNSEGVFKPNVNEALDAHDVVEWLAHQPYCNGQVAMWGGSYSGLNQWNAAKELPSHLATIVPVAAPYIGVDFPIRSNIALPYLMQWLTLVWGRTSQEAIFWNQERFWGVRFRRWFEAGVPFRKLDSFLGNPSEIFQEWIAHPGRDSYWDGHNPSSDQYARISIPVLTITGSYDDDQPGALMHHREHLRRAPLASSERHYLIVGPWDHAGTRVPQLEFLGLKVGPRSLLDLHKLHLDWYGWVMCGGPKPSFLKDRVAYYVIGADVWRYAPSLEAVTSEFITLFLQSRANPIDVFHSGSLGHECPHEAPADHYVYDPRDTAHAGLESTVNPESLVDQRMLHARRGRQLIYHSAPLDQDVEVSGFLRFCAWMSIDQPDTDFRAAVYEIDMDGSSLLLAADHIRARHRESLYEEKLIRTREPLRYDFNRFSFISRLVRKGCRLRLVVGPINSIYSQKNYNSGGIVSEESLDDARVVTVNLHHDIAHPSALHVPVGHPA